MAAVATRTTTWCWLVRCALLLALAAVVTSDGYYTDKRNDQSRPFVMGSRYGRSGPQQVAIAPRNDRFFMGSRYGKRSPKLDGEADGEGTASGVGEMAAAERADSISCQYTGLYRLYRCSPTILRRTSEASDESLVEDMKDLK